MLADRRVFLAGLTLLSANPGPMAQAAGQTGSISPTGGMPASGMAKTAGEFYIGVLGRAELSLSTSQMATEKASHKDLLEFAGFELGEAITVNMVLKTLGAKPPAMRSEDTTLLETMKLAARGAGFDRAYVAFQLENHLDLRNWADAYLHNSAGATEPAEQQGRALASLMLAVFKEHVAICKRITAEIKA